MKKKNTKSRRSRTAPPPQKTNRAYLQMWRVIEGAVQEAFRAHPEYLSERGVMFKNALRSVTKRVTGAVVGYAAQVAKGRSGSSPAAKVAMLFKESLVVEHVYACSAGAQPDSTACINGDSLMGDDEMQTFVVPSLLGECA